MGTPAAPPTSKGALSRHRTNRRMDVKELIWDAMLQHIISGMASNGSRKWSRITPATAEKAKPENPDTTPPRKIGIMSIRGLNSLIVQHECGQWHAPRSGQDAGATPPTARDCSGILQKKLTTDIPTGSVSCVT